MNRKVQLKWVANKPPNKAPLKRIEQILEQDEISKDSGKRLAGGYWRNWGRKRMTVKSVALQII